MATKKSSKKTASNTAKKATKKTAKKVTKKAAKKAVRQAASSSSSNRSLEALQSSAFDRRDDDTSLYSRDEASSYTSYTTQGEEEKGSGIRIVGIIVVAVILFLGFWLFKGQCSGDNTQTKIENIQTKPADQVKPEQKQVEEKKAEVTEKVEQAKDQKPAGESTTYTVVGGDVLSKIANKTGVSAAEIQKANQGVDLGKLKIGQVIKIPAK